ncbi:MAG TPA: TolC family protein [Parasegetibacter sp.]
MIQNTRFCNNTNRRKVMPWLMKCLYALVILAVSMPVSAQKKYEFTVQEAVELAYKNVVELKNKEIDLQIQEAMNKGITGQAMPQLSGSLGVQYYYKLPIFLFPDATSSQIYEILRDEGVQGSSGPITNVPDPKMQPVSLQQPWNANMGLNLTQLLFQPDVFVGLQARSASIELAKMNIEVEKENIKDSAYKRYYAVLIAQKQLEFLNDGVARIEKLVRDNEIMYKEGFIELLDVERAKVQLSNLKTSQTTLKNGIYLSYAALKFALGLSQKDTVILKDELSLDEVKSGILDDSFQYEDRKEYQLLDVTIKLRELDVKRYKLGFIPTISLVGNYSRQGMSQDFIFSDKNAFWFNTGFVGLNINVPIFDGFQRRSNMKQAQLRLQQSENIRELLKQSIDFQQTVSKESLKNALLNLDEQQRNIELAEKVYNTTKKKFEEGVGSSFDIIQAENDLQISQSNYFQALYDAIISKVNYQRALGKL